MCSRGQSANAIGNFTSLAFVLRVGLTMRDPHGLGGGARLVAWTYSPTTRFGQCMFDTLGRIHLHFDSASACLTPAWYADFTRRDPPGMSMTF